ncbi:hypothetical protein IZU99_07220 [Oscillospiraceae bacterium CM]|nr:hypothetical protein IZU99_07220 [Oscillospiraceae bacterium CM]
MFRFKKATVLLSAVILSLLLLASCASNAAVVGGQAASSPAASDTGEKGRLEKATAWAEAVKARDGKGQYNLMTKALQEKVYNDFAGLNWVTGTSSPWVTDYTVSEKDGSAAVVFHYATSTGPAGSYEQDLTFKTEDGTLKIDSISEPKAVLNTAMSLEDLTKLLGLTKDALIKAIPETPVTVDEGGLGFEKTGIRVWFDNESYTTVAQVLILSDAIDINGLKLGDSFEAFKAVFGEPMSDTNGDAHFKYGDMYLSVVRDPADQSGKVIAVYLLSENF